MIPDIRFCIAYMIVDVLCLVITIIVSSNMSRDSGTETQVRCFFLLLTANAVFVVFDAIWAFLVFSGILKPSELALAIVNGVCLTMIAFAAYFWLCFTFARFDIKITENRLLLFLAAVPAIAIPFLHIFGHFAGQNVIFTAEGISYGAVHTVETLVPLLYLVASTAVAIHMYRRAATSSHKRMCVVFIMFMVAPAAGGVFDIFVADMPVAAAGIIISIIFVMMSMQRMRISNDALTGLNNRRRADEYLEESIMHCMPDRPVYLFIIDIDRFKDINDSYGHLEGDHALQLMAEALRRVSMQANAFTARWGGDEFVVICTRNGEVDPARIADVIGEELDEVTRDAGVKYELSCSVGYAVCNSPSKTRSQLLADADKMLYRSKLDRH